MTCGSRQRSYLYWHLCRHASWRPCCASGAVGHSSLLVIRAVDAALAAAAIEPGCSTWGSARSIQLRTPRPVPLYASCLDLLTTLPHLATDRQSSRELRRDLQSAPAESDTHPPALESSSTSQTSRAPAEEDTGRAPLSAKTCGPFNWTRSPAVAPGIVAPAPDRGARAWEHVALGALVRAATLAAFASTGFAERVPAPSAALHRILIDTPRTADKTGDVCGAS